MENTLSPLRFLHSILNIKTNTVFSHITRTFNVLYNTTRGIKTLDLELDTNLADFYTFALSILLKSDEYCLKIIFSISFDHR